MLDATFHDQMIELHLAGVRGVSLAKTADIVMNRLKCDVIMCIIGLDELEN